jgi:hypothetical protein
MTVSQDLIKERYGTRTTRTYTPSRHPGNWLTTAARDGCDYFVATVPADAAPARRILSRASPARYCRSTGPLPLLNEYSGRHGTTVSRVSNLKYLPVHAVAILTT